MGSWSTPLIGLPPYSSQLATIERVWKLARRMAMHYRFFATLDELLCAVETCFDWWQDRMQCCIDYAALF